jgi:hypothetical protein
MEFHKTLTADEAQSLYKNDKSFRRKAYFKWWVKHIAAIAILVSLFLAGLFVGQILSDHYNHIIWVAIPPLSLCIALYASYKIANPFICSACGSDSVQIGQFTIYCRHCGMSYLFSCLAKKMYKKEEERKNAWKKLEERKKPATHLAITEWESFFSVAMPEELKDILLQENGIAAPNINSSDVIMLFSAEMALAMYHAHKFREHCSNAIPVAMHPSGDLIVYKALGGKVEDTYLMKTTTPNWNSSTRINVDFSLLNLRK